MIKVKIAILSPLILLALSCQPEVKFEEPQPKGCKNKGYIKPKYHGTYFGASDSSYLIIDKCSITQQWRIKTKMTKTEIDTTNGLDLVGDILYACDIPDTIPVTFSGDTVHIDYIYSKSVFSFAEGHVLRYFKRYYFINTKVGDLWKVKIMNLNENSKISIKEIWGNEENIAAIKEITDVKEINDSEGNVTYYILDPTRREMKKILKSGYFNEGAEFIRVD